MAIIRGRQMGLDMPTLAKQFKTSKSVIWATLNTPNRPKATGKPLKTSLGDDRITVRMSKKNPRLTSTDFNSELKDQYGVQDSFLNISQKISVDMARTLSEDVCATLDSSEGAQMNQDPTLDPDELDRVHAKRCEAVIKAKSMATKY
uniref:Uncharacterized protein n=1 Tax=Caenorhabditis japonica TaxID=281687 RepID=A0A8R1E7H2_CAEJA